MKKFDSSQIFQLLWGCALLLMGISFLFRIPEIIAEYSVNEPVFGTWYVKLSLYLVSILLIGGGGKKIHKILYQTDRASGSSPDSEDT